MNIKGNLTTFVPKKDKTMNLLIVVSGISLIAIGTLLMVYGQQRMSNELNQENIELAKKNTELAEQSLKQITGGDSWAFLSSGLPGPDVPNQPFAINLNHKGNYPLYDLTINFFEVVQINQTSRNLNKVFQKNIGTLTKTLLFNEPLWILELPDKRKVYYLAKLRARNGEITQNWIFVRTDENSWSMAMKVFKHIPNEDGSFSKVDLYEYIDSDFPHADISWFMY